MNLRDHDQSCGHSGAYLGVDLRTVVDTPLHWECRQWDCPGGAAVVIDYEAARAADAQKYGADGLGLSDEAIRCLVDGALGA